MRKEYNEYLQSDHWKQLRSKAIATWGDRCCNCAVPEVDVHHLRYGDLFDVTEDDLLPLCRRCHDTVHKSKFLCKMVDGDRPSSVKRQIVLAYLAGHDEVVIKKVKTEFKSKKTERIEARRARVKARQAKNIEFEKLLNKHVGQPNGVLLTKQNVLALRSPRGGYTMATLTALGIPYPTPSKWNKRIIGEVISKQAYDAAYHGRFIKVGQ